MTTEAVRPGIYAEIAEKFRRALRNRTGRTFTHEQVVAILRSQIWMILAEIERNEMLANYTPTDHQVIVGPKLMLRDSGCAGDIS